MDKAPQNCTMPRKSRNKSLRVKYTERNWQDALTAIRKGLSMKEAAQRYHIPYSTLAKHRSMTTFPCAGRKLVLSSEDESTLEEFIKLSATYGEGLSMKDIQDYVQKYVEEASIKTPWKNNRPGIDWFRGFMKRHPKLSRRKAEAMSSYRVAGCDPFIIHEFYNDLRELYKRHDISTVRDASRLYNCDETYFCHDPKNLSVIAEKGERRISKNIAGSGKENTTVLACGSADGSKLPPLIVYSGTYVWSSWIPEDDYPGTCYTAQKKGWMEGTLFCHWFEDLFLNNVPSKADRRGKCIILFFDGASCHINSRIVRKAKENDIILIKLPPNVTHYLQPLDLCVFKPLKSKWEELVREHNRQNSTVVLDKKHFATLLKSAWEDGFKEKNIKSGFVATGLFPINPAKFPEKAYNPEQLARYKKEQAQTSAKENSGTTVKPSTTQDTSETRQSASAQPPMDKFGATVELLATQNTAETDQPTSLQPPTLHKCHCQRTLELTQASTSVQVVTTLQLLPKHQASTSTQASTSHESQAVDEAATLVPSSDIAATPHKTPNKASTPRKTPNKASTPRKTPNKASTPRKTPQKSPPFRKPLTPRKSPMKGRRLSFEEFVRTQLAQNNKPVSQASGESMKRRKVSNQKGEILTSPTALKRLEEAEKEKIEKMNKKEEKKKLKEKEKTEKMTQKAKKLEESKKRKSSQVAKTVKRKRSRVFLDSEESSSDPDEPEVVDTDDSCGSEDFAQVLDNPEDENFSESARDVDIRLENYYAVYYDLNWYIGRVIDFYDEDSSKVKFLRSNLGSFVWPNSDDIQQVQNCFIFHGPITLTGSGPFELKRSDATQIKSKYSKIKQNLKSNRKAQ